MYKQLKFGCIIGKINGEQCDKSFIHEMQLNTHMLFEHGFLMPICSTGIEEKLFHDNMALIKEFRDAKYMLNNHKGLLKKRLLKSMYGRKANLTDVNQTNYFHTSLDNHHKHLHTRISFIDHSKYDYYRDLNIQLEEKLKLKGIVNR